MHEILVQMIDTLETPAHTDGPGDRGAADLENFFDLVHQLDGIAAFAVELVDEGEDRGIAQPAHFHQPDGALLDALGAVDRHQRRVHRRQGAVGILGKILVTGSVQQIDDAIPVGKLHHRGGHGDAPLAFQLHPVRGRVTGRLAALNRARHLDGTAEQQQLFGQGGLAGVRMGDDGEGAAPIRLGGKSAHKQSAIEKLGNIL